MKPKLLRFSALMLYALVLGVFWGTWFSLSRSMESLPASVFLENGRAFIGNLAWPMRFLMPGAILATLAAAFSADRRSPAFRWTLAAAILMGIAMAITLSVNVPIDNRIKTWTLENLPSDWTAIRNRWEAFHCLRTWISVAGFGALSMGVLARSDAG
jgi:hypothetical protein